MVLTGVDRNHRRMFALDGWVEMVFVVSIVDRMPKINCKRHYLWRAVDDEREVHGHAHRAIVAV